MTSTTKVYDVLAVSPLIVVLPLPVLLLKFHVFLEMVSFSHDLPTDTGR